MTTLQQLQSDYGKVDCRDLGSRKLEQLRDGLKEVVSAEIVTADSGREFIELLKKFRKAVAENDKLHGDNYPQLLNSLLSVGEDGLYSIVCALSLNLYRMWMIATIRTAPIVSWICVSILRTMKSY